ncbi:hypothetical protein GLOIN_2v1709121 [Rhizophagus clarus]|uniref:SAM domain-containing protein n=1 Tax=Rhizophagus clarus TaxID=94130 RepID=A0A8H3LVH5_9GLOM|nr:hypothetical protein GLOIN_2v1709121 [Rhizophagus clarus]
MSSETSTPYTPASTSTSVAGNETVTLVEEIKKYDTEALISFLQGQNLGLSETAIKILEKEEIDGHAFLKVAEEKLRSYGMPGGPAIKLADFAKECKDKKLRSFSSYKTKKDLKEVLAKHGVEDGRITDIPQFTPIRELTGKKISLNPQFEVVGEENTDCVDYAIKALEELICITEGKQYQIAIGFAQNVIQRESAFQTNKRKRKADDAFGEEYDYLFGIMTTATEWHFLLYTPDGISCTSRNPLNIRFVETTLEEGSEDEKELCKNVKRVIEVIVGLLRERVDVEKEPKNKKARVQEYLKKE